MADLEPILHRDLFVICSQWALLLDLPRITVARINGRVEAPAPISVGVLSFRRESGEVLAGWAHLLHEERDLHTALDLMDVVAVARFIDHHADYLAHHEAGRDACDEIGHIAAKVVEYVRQTKARRLRLGKCPKNNDRGGPCPGELVAFVRNTDALLPSEVRCSADQDHHWRAGEWRLLGALVWENECNETARRANARRPLAHHSI